MKRWLGANIQIGSKSEIDEDVILGYPSGRLKKPGKLIVGTHAKIRSGSILYQGVTVGRHFETGHHVVIREENKIGNSVSIWSNTIIDYGCRIGNRVKIHCNIYVAQFSIIEDDVFIAPNTTFANDKYPVSHHLEGPHIKRSARIGVNVTLLPGIIVGRDALVGAGSVVTKNVPDGMVVVGNPARVIGTVDEVLKKRKKTK